MSKFHQRALGPLLSLTFAALLYGCAGTPPEEPGEQPQPPTQEPELVGPDLTLPASEYRAQFNAAETALAGFDWMSASTMVATIPADARTVEDTAYIDYLDARIAWAQGDSDSALTKLQSASVPGNSAGLQHRINTFGYFLHSLGRDPVAAAQIAATLHTTAPIDQRPGWRRNTWHSLGRAPTDSLQAALDTSLDVQWLAWLELALLAREPQPLLSAQLTQWLQRHPDHPASSPLPGGLRHSLEPASQATSVALLLPLSGRLAPAGQAVLDGYLAAYFADPTGRETELRVIDTDLEDSVTSAYATAVAGGAELVIGPLSKQSVAELALAPERPVPVLALNRTEQLLPTAQSALVQLSLAPEDEARTLAELAYGRGGRSAMIIAPDTAWGEKVERALRERWTSLGGRIVSAASYGEREDYSRSVKDGLGLTASEARAREIRDMLATNIEFTPRRRQDPDLIFLLSADDSEARSIKPLLAFHYAGQLPVYALSSIYSGVADERNRDLNGIRFIAMPWLLGQNPELRVAITAGDTGSDSYTRLNALGADAHLLQTGFAQLADGPDALLRGNTGLLTLDPQLRIQRELSPATFDRGAIAAQPLD